VQKLTDAGHKVTVFNRGQTPAQLPPQVQRLYGDRQDHAQVRQVLQGQDYDVVYDVSGYTPADTTIMVEIFAGRVGHYVYTSSAAVYERRWYAPVTEDFPYSDVEGGAYGQNKASTEQLLLQAHRERGLPASIVRPWMVFGPGNPAAAREQLFFLRAELGRPVFLPFNGYVHMQYGHVADLAQALVLMAGNPRCFGEAYNVTGPDMVTMNGYLQIIAILTGQDVDVVYLDYAEARAAAAAQRDLLPFPWQYGRIASIRKAYDHFGFWPEYGSQRCTEDTYRWYRDQGLGQMEHDFSAEDALLAQYGSDLRRRGQITPGGEMPQVVGG
jgi:nucleoside-diphosphate-sugar epimerase